MPAPPPLQAPDIRLALTESLLEALGGEHASTYASRLAAVMTRDPRLRVLVIESARVRRPSESLLFGIRVRALVALSEDLEGTASSRAFDLSVTREGTRIGWNLRA